MNPLTPSTPLRPWRVVAEEVSREHDGHKMTELMEELLKALEQQKSSGLRSKNPQSPPDLSKTA